MIILKQWKVSIPPGAGFLGFTGEHLARRLEIETDAGPEWSVKLDIRQEEYRICNVIDLDREGNTLYADLTREMFTAPGGYLCQFRGLSGERTIISNPFRMEVGEGMNAITLFPPKVPSELEQMERRVTMMKLAAVNAAEHAESSAEQADLSRARSEAAADRSIDAANSSATEAGRATNAANRAEAVADRIPIIGDTGNWVIGDKDSGVPAQGPQGIQGPKGDKGDTGPVGPAANIDALQDILNAHTADLAGKVDVFPNAVYSEAGSDFDNLPSGFLHAVGDFLHAPDGYFNGEVETHRYDLASTQEAFNYNTNKRFIRFQASGIWGAWEAISTVEDISTEVAAGLAGKANVIEYSATPDGSADFDLNGLRTVGFVKLAGDFHNAKNAPVGAFGDYSIIVTGNTDRMTQIAIYYNTAENDKPIIAWRVFNWKGDASQWYYASSAKTPQDALSTSGGILKGAIYFTRNRGIVFGDETGNYAPCSPQITGYDSDSTGVINMDSVGGNGCIVKAFSAPQAPEDLTNKGYVDGALSAHAAATSHITDAERQSWNNKANKNHSHSPAELCTPMVGSYTGDGEPSRAISLGFRPEAVMVLANGTSMNINGHIWGGVATQKQPLVCNDGTCIQIGLQQFYVYDDGMSKRLNSSGTYYTYIAYRGVTM